MRLTRDASIVASLLVWIVFVLMLDRGGALIQQHVLGLVSWGCLVTLLVGESPTVRYQVLIAAAFATFLEYLAAPLFGFYVYRLDNVPAFVPPGHGMVYLGAIVLARSAYVVRHAKHFVGAALLLASGWAIWGVTIAARNDLFGLLLLGVFALFVARGGAPRVYAAAFFITTFLELLGTSIGTWTWAATDPTGWIGIGNPPSGIAAAYCLVDWVALRAVSPTARGKLTADATS